VDEVTLYATSAAPEGGPLMARDATPPLPVHLDGDPQATPIGMAFHVDQDEQGRAIWVLIVRGAPVPGSYIVEDRRFFLAFQGPAGGLGTGVAPA
jgi:hypothetical protein